MTSVEPIMVTIRDAIVLTGLSRSEIYRRLADRSIQARKNGRRTLILTESLRKYIANLPSAQFGAMQRSSGAA